jgi:hypothetical protein
MVNAVIFGVGMISVLSVPAVTSFASFWIPAVVLGSFLVSAPLAWFIAPWMMMRFQKANSDHWNR